MRVMELQKLIFLSVMYLNCIFEIYLLYNFLEDRFPVFEERRNIRFLGSIGCITAIFVINRMNLILVNSIAVPLILLLFVWMVFCLELKYAFIYVLFYYVLMSVTEFAFYYIYKLMGIDFTTVGFARVIVLVIQNAFRFWVIQIVKKQNLCSNQSENYQYFVNDYLNCHSSALVC